MPIYGRYKYSILALLLNIIAIFLLIFCILFIIFSLPFLWSKWYFDNITCKLEEYTNRIFYFLVLN